MGEFIILMHEDHGAWASLEESERSRLLESYGTWVGELRERGVLRGGDPIGAGGCCLANVMGEIIESPYEETEQVLTGFFIVEAADLDAAVELARGCPALSHGETVVVRPLGHD